MIFMGEKGFDAVKNQLTLEPYLPSIFSQSVVVVPDRTGMVRVWPKSKKRRILKKWAKRPRYKERRESGLAGAVFYTPMHDLLLDRKLAAFEKVSRADG